MKIFVTGTRGIPDIPGGVEKHCQELYPRIAALGHEVILATRTPYIPDKREDWEGVRLSHIFAPKLKSLEAIVHTFLALLKARLICPDVVHIHGVGPALLIPFAKIVGLKVVLTNHGPDYDRQKWGKLAKCALQFGEKLGGKFAYEIIVISKVIDDIMSRRYGRKSHLIYNGVTLPAPSTDSDYLEKLGLKPQKYILAVARFVPEKGLTDLLEAFIQLTGDFQLVIAGDADHETEYSMKVKKLAAGNNRVVLAGYITGEKLNQVFSHAALFVLPSYHEGLPIALLEALSFGLSVLVSDIPANQEVNLPPERFFRCGDLIDLRDKIKKLLKHPIRQEERKEYLEILAEKYDWSRIALQTIAVYQKVVTGKSKSY